MFEFNNSYDIKRICEENNISISTVAIMYEVERDETTKDFVVQKMKDSLDVMKENIQTGIKTDTLSIGGLIGTNAKKMFEYQSRNKSIGGSLLNMAIAYALAITEENARMKRIVACPTAGACGVVPGCLFAASEQARFDEDKITLALFNSSAIGLIIAKNASVSGAQGGCQAEVGAASAMAASALTELYGGSVNACFHAAAIALKNVLGLVCDPVGGLVEVPCSKRNAMGVANAIAAADMARAGISSVIPLDEVIQAMKEVGRALPFSLKETSKGGVANSKTAKEIQKQIKAKTKNMFD